MDSQLGSKTRSTRPGCGRREPAAPKARRRTAQVGRAAFASAPRGLPKSKNNIRYHEPQKEGFLNSRTLIPHAISAERIKPMFTDYEAKITELENKVVLFESRFNNMKIERVEKRIFT